MNKDDKKQIFESISDSFDISSRTDVINISIESGDKKIGPIEFPFTDPSDDIASLTMDLAGLELTPMQNKKVIEYIECVKNSDANLESFEITFIWKGGIKFIFTRDDKIRTKKIRF